MVTRRSDRTALLLAVAVLVGAVVPLAVWVLGSRWPVALLPAAAALGAWLWWREHQAAAAEVAGARELAEAVRLHDELTGCVNEAGLRVFAPHMLHAARRRGDALHAFVIDIDHLRLVNDNLGRESGDEVLLVVAEALRASTRGTDLLARGHADEFVILGPGCGVHPGEMERRVRAYLIEEPPVPTEVWPCRVTVGVGLLEPWDSGDTEDVVTRAYQDLQLRAAMRAPSAPEAR
ncbi:MAG TPA: GGDEF domain-containing protein [Actinomycetales bacterium]|jgi:diguanylate cyclase (GGDEF)-like protein|nr:GGDEF domain-containing protein [Actinomycetales bacterium]